jgi:hypothetical protein
VWDFMNTLFGRSLPVPPLIVFAVLACHDESPPVTGPSVPTKPAAMMAIDTTEDTWNYYSADVTITREAGQNTAQVNNGTTHSSFAIVRTLNGDMWSSDIAENPLESTGLGSSPDPAIDLGRLQTDDAGNYLYAYTRGGTPISITPSLMTDQYAIMDPPPGHDPLPRFPTPPPGASANVGVQRGFDRPLSKDIGLGEAVNHNGHRVDPRAWLANVVSTPKNRIALAAGRIKHLGPSVGKIRDLDRYVARTNGMDLEELVDPLTAATVERNLAVNGRLIVHQTRSFIDAGGGRFALAKIRIENARAGSQAGPMVTEISFNNVRIETRVR